ncbi:MAG TPA: cation transporter [Clostridia bacterium]|nr:cation transporter [Clostridia bacterium]
MKKLSIQLEQLTCPSCIRKIETTVHKTVGVDSAEVLFNSSKVKVQFDETKIEAKQLEKIIKSLGYSVLSTKVS